MMLSNNEAIYTGQRECSKEETASILCGTLLDEGVLFIDTAVVSDYIIPMYNFISPTGATSSAAQIR